MAARIIGVTGHRPNRLSSWAIFRLPGRARRVLARLERAAGATGAEMRLVSGLAEGADTIVAREALKRGWTLTALLPKPASAYERDFASRRARAAFRRLHRRADETVVVARAAEAPASPSGRYRAAGIAMVERIDALIAVHDRGEPAGPGGTHDVMEIARRRGAPIVEIVV
ncbi:hypothetical protein DDZ18_08940 [Marinicauda salina]|uniref:DUF2493 domain-containing protein n=1 Tax=Marinicauda salina TaxID=2135793 RepID=A0A2U2BUV9_9PROT|nr:hypothetical protein [Marinicauda salina]PWE17769.1 hypothetical protein DDZ18_08940 [Marinicauda salina]